MPLVSIVVPNYNYARYLDQRLGSISRQTFRDWEAVLLDDASTDESIEKLQRFSLAHKSELIVNEKNSGNVYAQWNRGFRAASGKYIWIAESDDFANERLLEVLVDRLENSPRTGVAYCGSLRIDGDELLKEFVVPTMYAVDPARWRCDFQNSGLEECIRYMIMEPTIPNASAVVFRRELLEKIGGADEGLRLAADWKFWASLLSVSDVAYVAEPMNFFRSHASTKRARTPIWTEIIEQLQVQEFIVRTFHPPADALKDLHARLAITLTYAWVRNTPSREEWRKVCQSLRNLQFGPSVRAGSKILRHAKDALLVRVPGTALNKRDRFEEGA